MSYVGFDGYQPSDIAHAHANKVLERALAMDDVGITNPCYAGDTLVHTDAGHYQIKDLVGKTVNVWNGESWIEVDNFRVTGQNQPVFTITLHDGSQITATGYHRFILDSGETMTLEELEPGMVLAASDAPLSHGTISAKSAYLKGFVVGDGSVRNGGTPLLWIYEPKWGCIDRLVASARETEVSGEFRSDAVTEIGVVDAGDGRKKMTGFASRKNLLPWCRDYKDGLPVEVFAWDLPSKLSFIAGLFDADGTARDTPNGFGYQLSSVSALLLRDVQALLKTFGVLSKIQNGASRPGGMKDFGSRGGHCLVQPLYRLTISQADSILLAERVRFSRLVSFAGRAVKLNHRLERKYRKIHSIEPAGVAEQVYCCTVPDDTHSFSLTCNIRAMNCGEIPLAIWGAFCLIGDLLPYHSITNHNGTTNPNWKHDTISAGKEMARFLIRTNLMRSLYRKEVERTNRIGVGLTGVHEFAWHAYGLTFRDMLDPYPGSQAERFWQFIAQVSRATIEEADAYALELGMALPETVTTIKPSGTVSKLWALTEGWHLPARAFYLRWVQFTHGDPLVEEYRARGYPVRDNLRTYKDTAIVGFPTRTELARIMPAERIVTAAEATFEEQATWLALGEHYWLSAGDEAYSSRAGQISYTLKYDPTKIKHAEFHQLIAKWIPRLKTVSVMPQENSDGSAYEYLPEEMITAEQYQILMSNIDSSGVTEDVDFAHVDCASGACPVTFNK